MHLRSRNNGSDLSRRRERRRSERFADFVLTEVTYPLDLRLPEHTHELACVALTLNGYSTETFGMRRLERPEETVLYRPYGEPHWDLIGNRGARCFLVEFDESNISDLAGVKPPLSRPDVRRGNLSRLALRAYCEWMQKDDAHSLVIQALAHEMVADIIRSDGHGVRLNAPVWLKRVKEALDDCYADVLTLTDLAALGAVHPMHLARAFRQHYHTSVGEYLRQRRIEAASDQLVHTDKPLTEIAVESGFSSHGHFCTAFKRVTSLTPSEFRQLRR